MRPANRRYLSAGLVHGLGVCAVLLLHVWLAPPVPVTLALLLGAALWRGVDFASLKLLLQDNHVSAPLIATPREIYQKFATRR